jgi:hypothetical protein
MSADVSSCPGPNGEPIPMVIFDNALPAWRQPVGKLAVSFADDRALFTTPRSPGDEDVVPILLSRPDAQMLGRILLGIEVPEVTHVVDMIGEAFDRAVLFEKDELPACPLCGSRTRDHGEHCPDRPITHAEE